MFQSQKRRKIADMKYVVTGGAGFIGANIVEHLLDGGHEVVVIDDLSTGKRERVPDAAKFVEGSITDLDLVTHEVSGADGIFHLAAIPRMLMSIDDPIRTNHANVVGTLTVLWAAKNAGVRRVVYSASSSAYGMQSILPFVETMQTRPMNPYGLQKFVGEEYCRLFSELYGLQTVSLRYFNVYGGKFQSADGAYPLVIALFLQQRVAGKPMTMTGDGEYRRDFTHVRDVVRANMLSMESVRVGKGEIINIGAGHNYSVREIADLIGGPVEFISERPGDPRATLADRIKAKELLGWEPQISIPEGIAELKKIHGIS